MKQFLLAAALLAAPATAFAAPVILNVPLTMLPGNVVSVVGQNFNTSSTVTVTPLSTGVAVSGSVKLSDTHAISFEVPSSTPFDIYTVQVTTSGLTSNTYQTNLPLASSFSTSLIYTLVNSSASSAGIYTSPETRRHCPSRWSIRAPWRCSRSA